MYLQFLCIGIYFGFSMGLSTPLGYAYGDRNFFCLSCFRKVTLIASFRLHRSFSTDALICWHQLGYVSLHLPAAQSLTWQFPACAYMDSDSYFQESISSQQSVWWHMAKVYLRYDYFPSFLCSAASFPDNSSEVLGIKWNLAGNTGSWDIDTGCCTLDVEEKKL